MRQEIAEENWLCPTCQYKIQPSTQQHKPVTSTYSYSVTETNIFGTRPSPSVPELSSQMIVAILAIILISATSIALVK